MSNPAQAFSDALLATRVATRFQQAYGSRSYSLKKDITSKKTQVTVPSGTKVSLSWKDRNGEITQITDDAGNVMSVRTMNLYNYVSGVTKPPSMGTLERWTSDGVAKTVTGERVEPDGHGSDGAPSWLLALGYI
jgi:hypothetical protein